MPNEPDPPRQTTGGDAAAPPHPAGADHLMQRVWRKVDLFAPSDLGPQELAEFVDATIRANASEAGEFVMQIHIGTGIDNRDGWHRWGVHYLPGPPGV